MNFKATLPVVLLGTLLSVPCVSVAKGGHGGSHGGLHAGLYGSSSVYTAIYDTNDDGTVTTAEVTAVRTADFNTADVNASATLTLAEFQNLETTVHNREIAAAFAILDTDTSATLTLAELTVNATTTAATTYLTSVFNLANTDGNTVLSLAEFTALQSHGTSGSIKSFARLDTDASATLTLTEYLASRSGTGHGGRH